MIRGLVSGLVGGMVGGLLPSAATADPTLVLDLNFLASSLPAGLTFSRASAATDIINGVLTSFASGSPRISAANGVLIEQQRTNLCTWSETINQAASSFSWQVSGAATSTVNTDTAPDGTLTADTLVGASGFFYKVISCTVGNFYTWSYFVKAGTATSAMIAVYEGTLGLKSAIIDLTTGVLSGVSAGVTATSTTLVDGWYRVSLMFTAAATGNHEVRVATSANTIKVWGCQMEAWGLTSYISAPSSSTVTRSGDVLYRDISTLYSATAGALLFDAYVNAYSQNQHSGTINYTTTTNIIKVTPSAFLMTTGGVNQANYSFATLTPPAVSKLAVAYASNDTRACLNGTLGTADTACTPPSGTMRLTIGADYRTSYEQLSGYMRRVRYWNVRKTDAELQGMTT